jgi:hypothetical protein
MFDIRGISVDLLKRNLLCRVIYLRATLGKVCTTPAAA